ncbi:MAG: PilZ domain-containing protein [Planctomycetes bacterium]|nr:PilZ domain-containing protein [Planctomycetota bacterium]
MTASESAILTTGCQLLVRFACDAGPRRLHIGCVDSVEGETIIAEFEEEGLDPPTGGQAVIFYYQHDGVFTQQPAKVTEIRREAPVLSFAIEPTGEPVSAECRQTPRVATVASDLVATIAGTELCPVLDVSVAGLSIMSSTSLEIGDVVTVRIESGSLSFEGSACIQSTRELWEGRYRYGLYCLDDVGDAELQAGLAQVAEAMQP